MNSVARRSAPSHFAASGVRVTSLGSGVSPVVSRATGCARCQRHLLLPTAPPAAEMTSHYVAPPGGINTTHVRRQAGNFLAVKRDGRCAIDAGPLTTQSVGRRSLSGRLVAPSQSFSRPPHWWRAYLSLPAAMEPENARGTSTIFMPRKYFYNCLDGSWNWLQQVHTSRLHSSVTDGFCMSDNLQF